jgi:cation-transporting ATPase 13A3/4/5
MYSLLVSQDTDNATPLEEGATASKPLLTPHKEVEKASAGTSHLAMDVRGYRDSRVGNLAWASIWAFSLLLVSLWLAILVDKYANCQVYGIDTQCYYGSYPITGDGTKNQWVFFCLWWIWLLWFGLLLANTSWLRNWFREPCRIENAQFIWIRKYNAAEVLTANPTRVVRFVRRAKLMVALASGLDDRLGDFVAETLEVLSTELRDGTRLRYVVFQYRIYFLSNGHSSVVKNIVGGDAYPTDHEHGGILTQYNATTAWTLNFVASTAGEKGVGLAEAEDRLKRLGKNEIPFKIDPIGELLRGEFFTKFFFYQFQIYMVWFWYSYLFVAFCEFSIVLLAAFLKMYLKRRNQEIIAQLTVFHSTESVLRDGTWLGIDSALLVPGDVIRVQSEAAVPCDIILIQGMAVCDESGLTGESMPVPKTAAPKNGSNTRVTDNGAAKHTLFAGTTVLQAGSSESEVVTGVVIATGIRTSKGELISHILNPPAMIFKYDEEFTVVFGMLAVFGCCLLGLVFFLFYWNGSPKAEVVKFATGVFTVSQLLSPLLPLALVVGEVAASKRLLDMSVFCINSKRIAISGKVRVCAFDKTGTITKEGLDFCGVRQISPTQAKFLGDKILSFEAIPQTDDVDDGGQRSVAPPVLEDHESETNLLVQGLATCHAVSMYGTEYIGNQVEVKMFSATDFSIVNVSGGATFMRGFVGGMARDIEVLKRFEFDHARMSMSVLVRSNGVVYAFCKGAAERMQGAFVPGSMPEDFIPQAQTDASNGFYVLALGYKAMGRLRSSDVLALKREDVEQGMQPLGLVLFRNELKEDSREAITKLREGDVRCVMITGDNAQTGLYVAKASSLVADTRRVFLADAKEPCMSATQRDSSEHALSGTDAVSWTEMGRGRCAAVCANGVVAPPACFSTRHILEMVQNNGSGDVELAMTGRAFSHFVRAKPTMDRLLFHTRIFARMSPTQKADTINLFIDKGLVTAMCGDGGNDCGALRAAHVGLALSEAEASVVSPFSSKTKSIHSMVDLLREGRCALATSFASYRFVLTYGQT